MKGGKVFIFRPVCYGVARLQLTFPFAQRCGCCGVDTISETPHVNYSKQFPLHCCRISVRWFRLGEANGLQLYLGFVTWLRSLRSSVSLGPGSSDSSLTGMLR